MTYRHRWRNCNKSVPAIVTTATFSLPAKKRADVDVAPCAGGRTLSVRGASIHFWGFSHEISAEESRGCGRDARWRGTVRLRSGTGLAQTTTPAGQPIRVEVTGTNIPRVDSETEPGADNHAGGDGQAGLHDDQRSPARHHRQQYGLLSQGFSRAFAGGASGVSLRGLSVGATLVLIDGLRMAPYPLGDDAQRNFVDVNNIPFSAVERIEVLLDGASAIYGSDAIGGVVNVILKKSFTGTGLVARRRLDDQGRRHHVARVDHAGLRQARGQGQRLPRARIPAPGPDHAVAAVGRRLEQFQLDRPGRRGSSRPARAAPPSRSRTC